MENNVKNDGLEEITNLAAVTYIMDAVVDYKVEIMSEMASYVLPENKKQSVAEKYKDVDFVGTAGDKLKGAFEVAKKKAIAFLGKSKEFINTNIYKSLVRAEERQEIKEAKKIEKIKEKVTKAEDKRQIKEERHQKRVEKVEAAKEFMKNDFEKTVAREKARQEAVHGFVDKTEKKFNDMIFATADKIGDGIQRFNSKSEDLGNAIKAKYNSWKQKGKDKLANALENTKAFGRLVKDKAVEGYEHIGTQVALGKSAVKKVGRDLKENAKGKYTQVKEDFVEGVKTGVEKAKSIKDDVSFYAEYGAYNAGVMAGKAKDGMVNAAVAFGGAAIAAPGIAIKGVKKGARGVALFGAKGLRNTLNKAADLAVKGAKALDEKINTPEKETQNKDDDAR